VAPCYFRQAKQANTIGGGRYHFAKDDWVFVVLVTAHRDPAARGPDADEFNPDRFLPENLRTLRPHVYKPFGTGARACVGRQFTLQEILLTLAAVVHQFDFEARPGYAVQASETLTVKPEGLQLRLHRRG
jgi:cytochrome P450